MTTEERLERLEMEVARGRRANRWLLAVLGAVLVAVVLAWAFVPGIARTQGAKGAPKEVRASKFVVEDENGKERATLDKGGSENSQTS